MYWMYKKMFQQKDVQQNVANRCSIHAPEPLYKNAKIEKIKRQIHPAKDLYVRVRGAHDVRRDKIHPPYRLFF